VIEPAKPAARGRLVFLVQAASLLSTGWVVWSVSLAPRLHQQTLGALVGRAVVYVVLAWLWSAAIALGLCLIMPIENRQGMGRNVTGIAATAVWFGPAMILLSEFSPVALLAALVLAVNTARLLYIQWRQDHPAVEAPRPPEPRVPGSFAECQLAPPMFRDLAPGLAVSFCLQAGLVSVALRYPLLGAGWLCMGTALLTVFSMAAGAAGPGRPPNLPRSPLGVLATMILAVMLTVAGTPGYGFGGSWGFGDRYGADRPGLVETARALLRRLFYGELPPGPGGHSARNANPTPPAADTGALGGYPGIILWPEIKPYTTLVALLPALGSGLFHGPAPQPLALPFSGEYWMFRWPFARPPVRSFLERGNPTAMSFSTTDRAPLQMEAHQKLDTPIAADCCGKIQVEIANADRFPGTIELALVLVDDARAPEVIDNAPARAPSMVLGRLPVTSKPDLGRDPIQPVLEILDFALPPAPSLAEFDELKVIFYRDRTRADKSARIAIERFVLVPR